MHRDEAIYARADAHAITLTADEAVLAANACLHSARLIRLAGDAPDLAQGARDALPRLEALEARLRAASTTLPS